MGLASKSLAHATPSAAAEARAAGPAPEPVSVRVEAAVDYGTSAALADEAFGAAGRFEADGMRWLYEDAFSGGTAVLGLYAGERKVGHLALVFQSVLSAGRSEPAVALMDVAILEPFRSFAAIVSLYRAVEALCRARGIRFIVSVPNETAAPINERILRLATVARLEIRVGLAGLPVPGRRVASRAVDGLDAEDGRRFVSPYCGGGGPGLDWTAERLWARLGRPGARYGLHAAENLLLVSAPRVGRRIPSTLICALLPRPGAPVLRRDVAAVTAAACRWHRRPLFVYAGLNRGVPLPGLLLPSRLRPSPMSVQLRDFRPDGAPFAFDRFEPLDFDFA